MGCCNDTHDIAYNKRWTEQINTFGVESECLKLLIGAGDREPRYEYDNDDNDRGAGQLLHGLWQERAPQTAPIGTWCCNLLVMDGSDDC